MRRSTWFSVGAVAILAVACGGNVKLGDTSSGVGSSGGSSSSGGAGTGKACTVDGACGPAPGAPAIQCWDGSIGGNTGRCLDDGDGTCSWEMRTCPPDPGTSPGCFDAAGELDPSLRKCSVTADCQALVAQSDCCGGQRAYGVSAAQSGAAQACADARAKAFPACDCVAQPTKADDGSIDPGGATPAVVCSAKSLCETSYKTTACGKNQCTAAQTCCDGMPFAEPTCVNGTMCPISQRKHKKDITYLSEGERQRLTDELLGFRLATYRYKSQGEAEREHLGFIIDDVAPSPAVVASGERVDMYGYATMSVAALQTQAREIAELRREVDELRRALRDRPSDGKSDRAKR